jgi:hypothetical protein
VGHIKGTNLVVKMFPPDSKAHRSTPTRSTLQCSRNSSWKTSRARRERIHFIC